MAFVLLSLVIGKHIQGSLQHCAAPSFLHRAITLHMATAWRIMLMMPLGHVVRPCKFDVSVRTPYNSPELGS